MTIDLNDKSNLVCVSISPQLTNDTLLIKEDFSPEELSDFFLQKATTKAWLYSCPYRLHKSHELCYRPT